MLSGYYPVFTKGRVLKKESVEFLRDFPYELASLACEGRSDGMLCGFKVRLEDGRIHVGKGAIKHRGAIVLVDESATDMEEYGQLLYIRLYVGQCRETEDYRLCPTQTNIDKRGIAGDNEVELGRFCLSKGAELRTKYDSFGDMRTPENTLDITRVAFSGMDEPTLHPAVLKEYAKALLQTCPGDDGLGASFALMCLGAPVVHKCAIQWYVAKKNHAEYKDYMLPALYDKLLEMLPEHSQISKQRRLGGKWPRIEL